MRPNTRKQIPEPGICFLGIIGGLERALRKQSGGLFLARGRVPPVSDASRRDVDEIGTGSMPKSVGMVHLSKKSYKNIRTITEHQF